MYYCGIGGFMTIVEFGNDAPYFGINGGKYKNEIVANGI